MDSDGSVVNKGVILSSLNETVYTQFQVRPDCTANRRDGRCVFKDKAFDLDDVYHISSVETYTGINCFFFKVYIKKGEAADLVLQFQAPTKSDALRWQRELYRAWTGTGEFEVVKETSINKQDS